jgi:hypothetical protein
MESDWNASQTKMNAGIGAAANVAGTIGSNFMSKAESDKEAKGEAPSEKLEIGSKALSRAGQGTALGSSFGPLGTVIGGAAGGLEGTVEGVMDYKKKKNIYDQQKQQKSLDSLKNQTNMKKGGTIKKVKVIRSKNPLQKKDEKYHNPFMKKGDNPFMKDGGVAKAKAKEILHDKTAHGKPLTDKQRKFFGYMSEHGKKHGGKVGIAAGMMMASKHTVKPKEKMKDGGLSWSEEMLDTPNREGFYGGRLKKGGKAVNFKSGAAYKKWLSYGHMHDKFHGKEKVKIAGKNHKVNHEK